MSKPPAPLKNHKNIEFLSTTGLDSLKSQKATCTKTASNVGPSSAAREMPLKWLLLVGPTMAHLEWYADLLSPHQLNKKTNNKRRDSGTPSDNTF